MRSRCWEIGLRSPEARKRSRSSRMDPSPAARTGDAKAQVTPAGCTERLPRIADEMTLTSLEAKPGVATHPALPNGSPDPRKASVPLDVTFHTQRVGDIARATALQLVMVGDKD